MADFALGELLSPLDFEYLVRDLLSKELSVELTAFAEGSDGGIDLRYSRKKNSNDIIVQCKRQKSIGKKDLLAEKEKIGRLNKLKKYYLATSSNISKYKSDLILDIFSKWMPNNRHIYDKSRINQLLDVHEDILKAHYKLWINSSKMFDTFINKALIERSKSLFQNIKNEGKYYVKSKSYNEAIEILNNHNYLIISGIPGIGKTTLAKILLREYAQAGFEIVEMRSVSEGEKFLEEDSTTKQVFYFDDFLGENFLQHDVLSGRSNDLVEFIKRISRNKSKKLILTTREYILSQAKERYEKLNHHDLNIAKQILDLEKYSQRIKAYILYNHLFYSAIDEEYIKKIIENKAYNEIINHRNYSPRIIERMASNQKNVKSEEYVNEFINHLDNPFIIWDRAFDNQISEGSKGLLYVLLSFDGEVVKQDLKEAYKTFLKQEDSIFKGTPTKLDQYLKEIENTFLNTIASKDNKHIILKFQNPSVKDFLINLLKDNQDVVMQMIQSIRYFEQLKYLINFIRKESPNKAALALMTKKALHLNELQDSMWVLSNNFVHDYKTSEINRLLIVKNLLDLTKNSKLTSFLNTKIKNIDIESIGSYEVENYLVLVSSIKDSVHINEKSIVEKLFSLITGALGISNFLRLFNTFPSEAIEFIRHNPEQLQDKFMEAINESIEKAEDPYDIEEIKDCIKQIENTKKKQKIDLISNTNYFTSSIETKRKEIENLIASENDEELAKIDDPESNSEKDEFKAEELFTLENFGY